MNGALKIFHSLKMNNVKNVFMYSGGSIMPLIDCFYNQNDINYYILNNEQGCSYAATAYGKVNNIPGVSIVTSGPGVTNSVTGLLDANNDSTPFVLISGQVSTNMIGTNAFQECPAVNITKDITKWSYQIENTDEIFDVINEAFRISSTGKKGSVHIDVPKDILFKKSISRNYFSAPVKKFVENNNFDYTEVIHLIKQSKKPIIICGKGASNDYTLVREFIEKSNIPSTTTLHGLGIIDETHKNGLKFLGMHGSVTSNKAVQSADLIIGLGCRFDDRITGNFELFAPEANKAFKNNTGGIINVNIDDSEFNKTVKTHFNYNLTCNTFLKNIIDCVAYNNYNEWYTQIEDWENKYPFYVIDDDFKTQHVLQELNKYIHKDCIITTGVGNHQMMTAQFIDWKYPNSMITSGSLGVMGTGLPYAIGACIDNNDKIIIDIDGDGSFNHSFNELLSIKRYNLPIKIIIMNDNCLSMVNAWEKLFFNNRHIATDLNDSNPYYSYLAQAVDIPYLNCSKKENVDDTLKKLFGMNGPVLCEFNVKSDLCLPLVSPGEALDNIIYKLDHSTDLCTNPEVVPS